MGYDPFTGTGDLIKVWVDRRGGVFEGSFSLTDEDGESPPVRLTDPDCKSLTEPGGSRSAQARAVGQPGATGACARAGSALASGARSCSRSRSPLPLPLLRPRLRPSSCRSVASRSAGLDGIFLPVLTPSASAGFSPWVAVRWLDVPVSIELGVRAAWRASGSIRLDEHVAMGLKAHSTVAFADRNASVGCTHGPART